MRESKRVSFPDLISRDRVVETLSRFAEFVGAGQPKRTSGVAAGDVFVHEALDDCELGFVPG
jgi:hypothetical protein